jgi:hypothetical protein
MKRGVLCNYCYNSLFELQSSLVTHHIFMFWVLLNKLHDLLYIPCNSLQFNCNFVKITYFQLLCNSTTTTTINVMLTLPIFIHPLKFGIMKLFRFKNYFLVWNIDIHCLLWLLMMVRNYDMWHNNLFCHMGY